MVHDPALLDSQRAANGGGAEDSGLPSFEVKRFEEWFIHSSHTTHPLRPIQVWGKV